MDSLALLLANLISPPVIAFAAGVIAVRVGSDLRFPEQVYQGLTIYLLLAIGFKGGSAMASYSLTELALPLGATLLIGLLIPLIVFFSPENSSASAPRTQPHWPHIMALSPQSHLWPALLFSINAGSATKASCPP